MNLEEGKKYIRSRFTKQESEEEVKVEEEEEGIINNDEIPEFEYLEKSNDTIKDKGSFRIQAKSYLLTYKTHIDKDLMSEFLAGIKNKGFERFIAAHETADPINPYKHTHVYIDYGYKFESTECRIFDYKGIHPNIKVCKGSITKLLRYLAKEDPENKGLLEEVSNEKLGNKVLQYTSESDMLLKLDMRPIDVAGYVKSFNIMLNAPKAYEHLYKIEDFNTPLIDEPFRCIFLKGESGWGKTQWAACHFKNPLVVTHIDDFRNFKAGFHDGLVMDDISLKHLPRESVIQMTDWDLDRSIHGRNVNAKIPKNTRKIFVTNKPWDEYMPYDEYNAIYSRFSHIIELEGPLMDAKGRPLPKVLKIGKKIEGKQISTNNEENFL
jgi:hypothetical protein